MADKVFEMNWQELPNGLQKYFILMIANMQKPIYYFAGGIVVLDLYTFTNVRCNSSKNAFFRVASVHNHVPISAIQTSYYILSNVQDTYSLNKLSDVRTSKCIVCKVEIR